MGAALAPCRWNLLDLAKVIGDSFLPRCALRAAVYAFARPEESADPR